MTTTQKRRVGVKAPELFEKAFQSAAVGMGVLESNGSWTTVNEALCRLLGYERAEFLRLNVKSVTHPDDVAETMKMLGELSEGKIESYQRESRDIHRTGRIVWALHTGALVQGVDGVPLIVEQIQDITERKQAEEALRRSEKLFRTIGENAGDLILVVNCPSLVTEYASPTYQTLLGYSPTLLIGRNSLELVDPGDHPLIGRTLTKMLDGKTDGHLIEVRFKDAHGQFHHVEAQGRAVRSDSGKLERIVVIARIIDERYAAQKKLKMREQELQLLIDSTGEGIFGTDLKGNCTVCNSACVKILGYNDASEILGRNFHSLIHHKQKDGSPCPMEDCRAYSVLRTGSAVHFDDEMFWRADGTSFPVEYWCYPMKDDGKLVGSVVAFNDITGRKFVEDELRKAHEEAEFFINSVPSILISLDGEGRIQRWNSAAAMIFGLRETEVLGKFLPTCGIRWLCKDIEDKTKALFETKRQTRWDDALFERDGEERHLGLTITWITPPHSKDGELLIVGADVTQRRQAEEELHSKTAFLEAQTNATMDGILVVDENRRTILQNQRFAEIFEIPKSISNPTDNSSLRAHMLPQIKNPQEYLQKVEQLYVQRDEKSRDELEFKNGMVFDRYSSPVIGKDGRYYGRMWIFHDITERKRNEDAVRKLSQAVEQSPVSVVMTDLKGNISYVNRRFTESTGYKFEEVLGKNPRFLKSGHTAAGEYKQLWEAILQGHEWRGEFCNRKKGGELFWESVVITPIKDVNGNPMHFLAVKEDISERKVMESHLRQAQKLEAIGQLAAGIAHEINTPIQFIGDNTQFVKDAWASLLPAITLLQSVPEAEPEQGGRTDCLRQLKGILEAVDCEYLQREIPRALDQSLEGIGRVAKIVLAMKEFSHPGSEDKQPTNINQSILTTLTVARNEWKYIADVETNFQVAMEMVPCHAGELNQVFLNLLINSAHAIVQALGEGSGSKGKITIRTTQDDDWTTISIQDTGAGIPAEIGTRIFEPFFTTKEVGKGTGQGLALAHNAIVKKHAGRLWFESEVGKGTTFHIQLPRKTRVT